jgi:lipoprotein-anchoring transpeptidase ErfK/SrfK
MRAWKLPLLAAVIAGFTLVAGPSRAERDTQAELPGVFGGALAAAKAKEKEAESETTRQYDALLAEKKYPRKFKIDERFQPQTVPFTGFRPGTIVIDTGNKFLYLVERWGKARRYGVAVGSEGLEFKGKATIKEKQEWPRWIPTKDMIARQPAKYAQYKDGMDGGPDNPLGARALYLYQGNVDTHIRIHGTNQPWTIGSAASNGCFRMINEHVIELYERVKVGAEVVVM